MWLERVIGDFRTEQLGLMIAASQGAKGVKWTTLDQRIEQFDEALAAEPPKVDTQDRELRAALGLKAVG